MLQQALAAGHLRANESIRMMYILGRVLSICPLPDILAYLDEVLLPRVTELQELAHQMVISVFKLFHSFNQTQNQMAVLNTLN